VATRADITPDQARDARARAWSLVFECWRKKQEGGPPNAHDDAKGSKDDRATPNSNR
jgi:hypothetical protein